MKVLEDGDAQTPGYDRPSEDVLADAFDAERATATLLAANRPVADVLLDQSVFGGVSNIVKNEMLSGSGCTRRRQGTCSTSRRPGG